MYVEKLITNVLHKIIIKSEHVNNSSIGQSKAFFRNPNVSQGSSN